MFTPIALIGQVMPGGGRLWTIEPGGVSAMNAAGEVAFLARLTAEQTGLFLRRADGSLALIMKSGTKTALGKMASVGRGDSTGVALNGKGEIAVTGKISGTPETLYLLTPTSP